MSGKLELVDSEDWAKCMPVGTTRLKESWLLNRAKWVDEEGKPLAPNWALSNTATEIADLIHWDYWHPAENEDSDCEALAEISELPESLQLACQETSALKIDLDLQMAAWRRRKLEEKKDKEGEHEQRVKTKRSKKRQVRQVVSRLSNEKKMRSELNLAIPQELSFCSPWRQQQKNLGG